MRKYNRGMANFIERIDQALQKSGCHYDADNEQFMDGERQLELVELTEILPELTLDELTSYQDSKGDELAARHEE
jgi:hypothetical protein